LASFAKQSEILEKNRTRPQAHDGSPQNTTSDGNEASISEWTLGLLEHISFRELLFIEDSFPGNTEATPLKKPSMRGIGAGWTGTMQNERINQSSVETSSKIDTAPTRNPPNLDKRFSHR
jgi:hypothetical protein